INLTDVTIDDAISELKTTLLNQETTDQGELFKFQEIFRSIYKIPDLRVGFTIFNSRESTYEKMNNREIQSFILDNENSRDITSVVSKGCLKRLFSEKSYCIVTNLELYYHKYQNHVLAKRLIENEIKSFILDPIAYGTELLGVLELDSYRKNELNTINAIKLNDILPYIVTAVQRNKNEFENRVKAVIQS